ncbi:MAG: DUF488 domain-containing protein [Deltaproteobacteria bacterium]
MANERRAVPHGDDRPLVFTVGHGSRTTEEVAALLQAAGVRLLVDVRSFPSSRHSPWLARAGLAASLPPLGIDYRWMGESLGGRRRSAVASRHPAWRVSAFRSYADHMDTPLFQEGLSRLEAMVREGPPLAFMCSETVWWRCHRRLIADALTVDGFAVVHLMAPGKLQPHPLNPALRIDASGRPVYDVVAP